MALYKAKGSRGLTGGHWVTIKDGRWKGQHVYIKDGQTFDQAIEDRKKHAQGLENRPVANKLAKQKQNKIDKENVKDKNRYEYKDGELSVKSKDGEELATYGVSKENYKENPKYWNEQAKREFDEEMSYLTKDAEEEFKDNATFNTDILHKQRGMSYKEIENMDTEEYTKLFNEWKNGPKKEPSYKVKQGEPLKEMAEDRIKDKQEALKSRQQLVEMMKAQNVDKFGEDTIDDLEFKNWRDQNYIYTANNDFENLKKNTISQEEKDKYMKEHGLTLFGERDEYNLLKEKQSKLLESYYTGKDNYNHNIENKLEDMQKKIEKAETGRTYAKDLQIGQPYEIDYGKGLKKTATYLGKDEDGNNQFYDGEGVTGKFGFSDKFIDQGSVRINTTKYNDDTMHLHNEIIKNERTPGYENEDRSYAGWELYSDDPNRFGIDMKAYNEKMQNWNGSESTPSKSKKAKSSNDKVDAFTLMSEFESADYGDWNNSNQEQRDKIASGVLDKIESKYKSSLEDEKTRKKLLNMMTDRNFHTEAKILEERYSKSKPVEEIKSRISDEYSTGKMETGYPFSQGSAWKGTKSNSGLYGKDKIKAIDDAIKKAYPEIKTSRRTNRGGYTDSFNYSVVGSTKPILRSINDFSDDEIEELYIKAIIRIGIRLKMNLKHQ